MIGIPGRRKHDTEGSARNYRRMRSGKKRHQRWQLGRAKKNAGPTWKGGGRRAA